VTWVASYGTDDCSYYEERCQESGGAYYCEQAPYWCAAFPRGDGSVTALWSRCTRRCLQDCDRAEALSYCPASADDRPDPFAIHGASFVCHGGCYASCLLYAASGA
jgi:hypothetical protein